MNNRYLYRAKRTDNGEWMEGCLLIDYVSGQYFIHANGNSVNESDKVGEEGCLRFVAFAVDPSTICQCTGLKNFFEKDIVKRTDLHRIGEPSIGIIEYDVENTAFVIHWIDKQVYSPMYPWKDKIKVIGSTIGNPELLEVGE